MQLTNYYVSEYTCAKMHVLGALNMLQYEDTFTHMQIVVFNL